MMKDKKIALSRNYFLNLLLVGTLGLSSLTSCRSPNQKDAISQQPSPTNSSDTTTKYLRLVELLQGQQWIEADKETENIISEIERNARLKETGGIPETETFSFVRKVSRISCNDYQLWMKYSQGKFGLGIQLKVWNQVGRPSSESTQTGATNTIAWDIFGDRVGWRNGGRWLTYYDLKSSPLSSVGMLPYYGFWFGQNISNLNVDGVEGQLSGLFLYLEQCGL